MSGKNSCLGKLFLSFSGLELSVFSGLKFLRFQQVFIYFIFIYSSANDCGIFQKLLCSSGTEVCRNSWHSAGSLGWPFPVLKNINIFFE